MLKNFVIPNAVFECWKLALLDDKSIRSGCEIADIKKWLIPKDVIAELMERQIFTSDDSVSSYKIDVQKKEKNKTHISTKHCFFICSQCCLPYGDFEKNDGESMRKFEDRLTQKMLEEKSQQSLKPQSDSNLIKTIEKKVDPDVVVLLRAGECFKDTPGYKDLLKTIISDYYGDLDINSGRGGHLFELKAALSLEEKENDQIEAFGKCYRSPSAKAEFDLVTVSGKFIECKLNEKWINKSRIGEQARIAEYHKKQFVVYVEEKLSDDMKNWFCKNEISFKDGFEKRI